MDFVIESPVMDREIDLRTIRMRRGKKIVTAVIAAAALLFAVAASMRWLRPGVDRSTIRTSRVVRGPLQTTVESTGVVVPAFEKVISSPVEARILRVITHAGSVVHPGDPILELDTSGSRLELARYNDELQQKRNERLRAQLDLENSLRDKESRIEQQKLDTEILEFKAQENNSLRKEGLIPEEAARQSAVALKKSEIELVSLQQSLDRDRRSNLAQLAALDSEISVLVRARDEAARQLELATTRSDRDGVVTWVPTEEGATVRRGDLVARIADLSAWRILASTSDVHAAELHSGLTARIRDSSGEIAGVVGSVDPTIQNGVVKFYIDINMSDAARLRNNQRVDVFVVTGHRDNVLKLATGPWQNEQGGDRVFVVHGDRASRSMIRTGLGGSEEVEIKQGLSEGDEVIVSDMREYLDATEIRLR